MKSLETELPRPGCEWWVELAARVSLIATRTGRSSTQDNRGRVFAHLLEYDSRLK